MTLPHGSYRPSVQPPRLAWPRESPLVAGPNRSKRTTRARARECRTKPPRHGGWGVWQPQGPDKAGTRFVNMDELLMFTITYGRSFPNRPQMSCAGRLGQAAPKA